MTPNLSTRFLFWLRPSAAALLALAVSLPMVMATPAAAQEEEDLSFEERFIKSLLGGGGRGIEYRERSPLVIPPARDLPPPEPETGAAAANPAWPRDPDRARGRSPQRAANASGRDAFDVAAQPLTPGELRRGARAGAGRHTGPAPDVNETNLGRALTPDQMGDRRSLFGMVGRAVTPEKPATFTKEPERRSLTQPPAGYQTPVAQHPYAPPASGGSWFGKVPTFFDRGINNDR